MNYELWISLRYLISKRQEKFISFINFTSMLGVAIGVMALILVIGVMNGFDADIVNKILGINAHIIVQHKNGITNSDNLINKLKNIENIKELSAFIEGQAMVKDRETVTGILLRGVPFDDPNVINRLNSINLRKNLPGFNSHNNRGKIDRKIGKIKLSYGGEIGQIIIGDELAKKLNVIPGDSISIISPADIKLYSFIITGIFHSGMYDYDGNLVFTDILTAKYFFNKQNVSGVEIRINNAYDVAKAGKIKNIIKAKLGYQYFVVSWMDINKNLFSALKLEKTVMFIILTLIILVACFNIISSLIMTVMEKTKDIGILKSMGATNASIKKIFVVQGMIINTIGIILGASMGYLLAYLLKTYKFIKLPQDIYYIDRLPVQILWTDSIIIISGALLIGFCAAIYPAWQAAKLNPVEMLRYE